MVFFLQPNWLNQTVVVQACHLASGLQTLSKIAGPAASQIFILFCQIIRKETCPKRANQKVACLPTGPMVLLVDCISAMYYQYMGLWATVLTLMFGILADHIWMGVEQELDLTENQGKL